MLEPIDTRETSDSNASSKAQKISTTRYEKLHSDHCIRVLTLFPSSNEDDEIVCTLKEHDFDETIPKFTALSYTWGSPKNPKSIRLNGYRATIRSSLHAALTHIRHAEIEKVLWIDALCINQQDVKERNQQVPLMRDIYMVAEDVLAWLGPAAPGIDPENGRELYEDIISRPYWGRVWIIQEFVLGKKVVFQCGHTLYDWENLYDSFPPKHERRGGEHLHRLIDLKRKFGAGIKGLNMSEAIQFAHGSEATDPRDKIYGIQGLVWADRRFKMVRPDYGLSLCEVYYQVIKILVPDMELRMPAGGLKKGSPKGCQGKRCDGLECWIAKTFESIITRER